MGGESGDEAAVAAAEDPPAESLPSDAQELAEAQPEPDSRVTPDPPPAP